MKLVIRKSIALGLNEPDAGIGLGLNARGSQASVGKPGQLANEPSRPGARAPHYSSHKMRRLAASGLGEAGALQLAVQRMMRTEEEHPARVKPHVLSLDDVTRGIVIDSADQQRIQKLVTDTSPEFSQKSQTVRIVHARGRLASTLKDSMKHIDAETRMEVLRRATEFWKREHQTDYGKEPTVRFIVRKAQPGAGPFIGPRGGKWADPQHTVPWTDIKDYKLRVHGEKHAEVATSTEKGIKRAADICKVNPPVCKDNLGIPRKDMPQLSDEVRDAFLKDLHEEGTKIETRKVAVGHLKATQGEINADKVLGMAAAYKSGKYDPSKEPIVVSKEGYVLDGHHRWAAMLHHDPGAQMNVYHVDMPIKELLSRAMKAKGVEQAAFMRELLARMGEGSRGGKVVGHTASGKAIYESHRAEAEAASTAAHAKGLPGPHRHAAERHALAAIAAHKAGDADAAKKHWEATAHHRHERNQAMADVLAGRKSLRFTLEKGVARGGKYYRRVATGNPKRPWRYYYHREDYERDHGSGAHISGPETKERQQKLPDDPWRYFNRVEGAELIPVSKLRTIRARPEGIANAAVHMRNAYEGKGERRKPISLRAEADGTYTVLDGNSTTANARQSKWKAIPAIVESSPEHAEQMRRLAGAKEALEHAIDEGKLNGTVSHHVKIAHRVLKAHETSFAEFKAALTEAAPKGAQVQGRVKKIDSVLGKLVRKPKYGDARGLQDATGARIVCNSIDEVRSTVAKLKAKYEVVTEDNRIASPQAGYRSHHLIVKHNGLEKEIQVRTQNQHTWAEWAHDVYKPLTEAQERAVREHMNEIDTYAQAASEYFYRKDSGKPTDPPSFPPCTKNVQSAFGCMEVT